MRSSRFRSRFVGGIPEEILDILKGLAEKQGIDTTPYTLPVYETFRDLLKEIRDNYGNFSVPVNIKAGAKTMTLTTDDYRGYISPEGGLYISTPSWWDVVRIECPQAVAVNMVGGSGGLVGKGLFRLWGGRVKAIVFRDDYGGNFATYTPPTTDNEDGDMILVEDTNATAPGRRLYVYLNGVWYYVDLT